MKDDSRDNWEQVWQNLLDYAPMMSPQGREYLDLAARLMRVNESLMEIPDLEDEAFQEVQSISMLLHSVGAPEERYLLELIDLITHLLDRLYVRLEYVKWEVSPLSQLSAALPELAQDPDLSNGDRELLAFLSAYDAAVRTGRGLADPWVREQLQQRASLLSSDAMVTAQRRLRAMTDQVVRLLDYYADETFE